jgi:hypothetical protein
MAGAPDSIIVWGHLACAIRGPVDTCISGRESLLRVTVDVEKCAINAWGKPQGTRLGDVNGCEARTGLRCFPSILRRVPVSGGTGRVGVFTLRSGGATKITYPVACIVCPVKPNTYSGLSVEKRLYVPEEWNAIVIVRASCVEI